MNTTPEISEFKPGRPSEKIWTAKIRLTEYATTPGSSTQITSIDGSNSAPNRMLITGFAKIRVAKANDPAQ
jgi:hypothetical protein